jgi:hypothetical protein
MTLADDPTFFDYKGVPQGYQKLTFTVHAGAQRLDATIAHPGSGDPATAPELNMSLFDPDGNLAASTYQSVGEPSNFGHIDVRVPQAGTWTAVIFTRSQATTASPEQRMTRSRPHGSPRSGPSHRRRYGWRPARRDSCTWHCRRRRRPATTAVTW